MRVITKIARQKNNPERYNIYVNEEYAFPVDEAIIIQFGLTKGKILEEFDIQEIAYEDEIRKAFNKGLNFLSYQMRSEHEVKKKTPLFRVWGSSYFRSHPKVKIIWFFK